MVRFRQEIVPKLVERLGLKNAMAAPRLEKITLNMGLGKSLAEKKRLEAALEDLKAIAGQRPIVTRARKAIAGFKLKKNDPVGAKVTLRGKIMYEFLDRLIAVALPRVRDFQGVDPNAFDGRGGFSMGFSEQGVFPEVATEKVEFAQGLNVAITTTARKDEESRELLRLLGMPFKAARAAAPRRASA